MPDGLTHAVTWSAVARTKTYELVLQRIEEQIFAGNLRVGDRLPPERDLATQLGVSRSSIREAVRILEAQGVVLTGTGTGPDAGTVVAALPAEALTRVLRLHLALSNFDLTEMIEARVALERASAQLAARDATEQDLAAMGALLDRMDDPRLSTAEFNDLDTDFHVAVARASHNRLISDVTVALRASLRGHIHEVIEQLDDWAAVRARLIQDHRGILASLRAHDEQAAAARVERHIRGFAVRMLPPGQHTRQLVQPALDDLNTAGSPPVP